MFRLFIAMLLITGFSKYLGAGVVFMGIIGITINTVALLSYSFIGAVLILVGSTRRGDGCALFARFQHVISLDLYIHVDCQAFTK